MKKESKNKETIWLVDIVIQINNVPEVKQTKWEMKHHREKQYQPKSKMGMKEKSELTKYYCVSSVKGKKEKKAPDLSKKLK